MYTGRTCEQFPDHKGWMIMKVVAHAILDKRAMSNVVSAVILTGVVIALSMAVFGWSESRASDYSNEYSDTVDAETAKLQEKLAFEYVYYACTNDLSVYLLNYGTIGGIEIKTVYVYDSGGALSCEPFVGPTLYLFQSWDEISELDRGEEGRLVLELSPSLSNGYYNVRIVTERGATFDTNFVVSCID